MYGRMIEHNCIFSAINSIQSHIFYLPRKNKTYEISGLSQPFG